MSEIALRNALKTPRFRKRCINDVTESQWAYHWAVNIGDREVMRDRIVDSKWAFKWAAHIGDLDTMRNIVTDPVWIAQWNECFPGNCIDVPKVDEIAMVDHHGV